jgi:uncharacterized membrane protein YcaP (DUF421 family)
MASYFEIILRTLSVYVFIVAAIRLFGKTELAQLTVFDLVFILLISNSVQNAMVGPDTSLLGGLLAAGSLFALNFAIKYITFKSGKMNKFLQGEPIMLVHKGQVLHAHMEKVRLTQEELEAAMREHGVAELRHVDLAVLETDGNISILSDDYKKQSTRRRKGHREVAKNS